MERMQLPGKGRSSHPSPEGSAGRTLHCARALAGASPELLAARRADQSSSIWPAVLWLEEFLLSEKVALFFVTHDRGLPSAAGNAHCRN